MSTINRVNVTCAVCQKESEQMVVFSTSSFGHSDLDLRPPELSRSTMCFWLQECPHCGYVSDDISEETKINKDLLSSQEYTTCDGIKFESSLPKTFYRHYLISASLGKEKASFYDLLHAAWACDDNREKENAVHCRKLALSKLNKKMLGPWYKRNEDLLLVKADLLRRAGEFDALITEYRHKRFSRKEKRLIALFQMEKARLHDTSCYTVGDVLRGK